MNPIRTGWPGLRPFLRVLRSLVVIYLAVAVFACSFSDKLIFLPPPPQYAPDDEHVVLLDPGPSQVACVFLPPAPGEPVLLWSHGNAEDLGLLKPLLADFANLHLGVLAYDYPGYGHSAGKPGEQACYQAALRAYRFLVVEKGIAPHRIVLVGQSVGSGPACWLAEREEAGGLILLAPFLSAFRTFTHLPLLPGDKFHNLRRIHRIDEPLLVIHGTRDEEIPLWHGQRLVAAHRGPKQLLAIPAAAHNDLWNPAHHQLREAIRSFARQLLSAP